MRLHPQKRGELGVNTLNYRINRKDSAILRQNCIPGQEIEDEQSRLLVVVSPRSQILITHAHHHGINGRLRGRGAPHTGLGNYDNRKPCVLQNILQTNVVAKNPVMERLPVQIVGRCGPTTVGAQSDAVSFLPFRQSGFVVALF